MCSRRSVAKLSKAWKAQCHSQSCQVNGCAKWSTVMISITVIIQREANTYPIQLQICYSLVQGYICAVPPVGAWLGLNVQVDPF